MKTLLFANFLFMFTVSGLAQPGPDTLWTRLYGWGEARSVQQTTDGGYIIGGNIGRLLLIKTDDEGHSIWSRTYGTASTVPDIGESVQQTTDGGFILAGTTWTRGAGTPNFGNVYVVKTNSLGDTLWTRVYGGSSSEYGRSVQQTTDGGYVIAGTTASYGISAPGNDNFYLIRTDSMGDTVWTRTYGGTGVDDARSVQQTTDGGFIIAGWTFSFGLNFSNVYLVKTNSEGDTLWTRTYGGNNLDQAWSVQLTSDGGYIVGGDTWSFGPGTPSQANIYLIKTDSLGETVWTRVFGRNSDDRGRFARQTRDGGYVIVGPSKSFGAGTPAESNYYLVKTDSEGDTLWTRAYGGTERDWANCVQQSSDGGYVIAGMTGDPQNGTQILLVKTAADLPPQPLHLLMPNGGDRWPLFTRRDVTWVSDPAEGLIRIELNRSFPEGQWEMLADSTANDGIETVAVTGPSSSLCRVRVSRIGEALSDISDGNFGITTSQGILQFIRPGQPDAPLTVWNAEIQSAADSVSDSLRLKNFGSEVITILPLQDLVTDNFSASSGCDTLVLEPGAMSSCAVRVAYHPQMPGAHADTIAIRTNSGNGDVNNVVRLPLAGQYISGAEDDITSIPGAPRLLPVYPNPFNATAEIVFELPASRYVSLRVFDLTGREVCILTDGVRAAGTHRIQFGTAGLSSGIYFARLESGVFSQTTRLTLLK